MSTVMINSAIWDRHASPFGLACLTSTIAAAYFYQQAPLRPRKYAAVNQDEVEAALELEMEEAEAAEGGSRRTPVTPRRHSSTSSSLEGGSSSNRDESNRD